MPLLNFTSELRMNMSKIMKYLLCGMFSLLSFSQALASDYDIHNKAQVEAYVDGMLTALMEKAHNQTAVVVIKKDDEVILSKGYGFANIEEGKKLDPNTSMVRTASISKLFTWVSVMQLVEQGRLDLDSDVNSYLTQFQIKDSFPGQPVTLRHIMTHTAGFEDGGAAYLIIRDRDRVLPLAQSLDKYQPERVYAPGERVAYSNYATAVAGLVVANISGEDFFSYVENHIFTPLGMKYATFREPLPDDLAENRVVSYLYGNGKWEPQSQEYLGNFAPAGASSVSAMDMVKFGQMLVNGGSFNGHQIIKPETIQYMLDNGYVKDPRVAGMGLGFIKQAVGDKSRLASFGHDGATGLSFSSLVLSQAENLVVFMSASSDYSVMSDFVDHFYQTFFPAQLDDITPPENFAEYGAKYTGSWVSARSNFNQIDKLVLRAMSVMEVSLSEDNYLLIWDQPFIEVEKNLFRHKFKNTYIAFLENAEGEITGFVVDGNGTTEMYRAKWWETTSFSTLSMGLSSLIALLVLIRVGAQWRVNAVNGRAAKWAYGATVAQSITHLMFLLFFVIALSDVLALYNEITLPLKIAICFSTLALPITLFHIYCSVQSWLGSGVLGTWSKIKHTIISLFGLLALVFYYTWNLIGFNYY
jgi:CubicO group peptidase (beta-lactamase class C family)